MNHDRQISISVGRSRTATQWEQKCLTVAEFYSRLKNPVRSAENQAEYLAMKKPQQDALKDVGGFVGGGLKDQRRKKENVTGRDLITLDFDNIPSGGTDAVIAAVEQMGCSFCIYSTRKHRWEAPRLRVVIPLDRTASPDEYEPLARYAAARIGMEWADPTTFEACRLMYWPSCSSDGEYVFRVVDSPLMSVDRSLEAHELLYGDWHDPRCWARGKDYSDDEMIRRLAKKQGDPLEKTGVVGAFCRVYDVHRAIAELIPDAYSAVENSDNRYSFVGGSTYGGAVVYDGGRFLFSHHATDPCGGKLVNAFDLVRLHKFGNLDDTATPGTPVVRRPSYTRMLEFIRSLPDVNSEITSAAADFAGLEADPEEDESWKQGLDTTSSGGLKNSLNNFVLILENDARLKGRLRKNTFNDRIEVVGELPWKREQGKAWGDIDTDHLRIMLDRIVDSKVNVSDVLTAVNAEADRRSYHPVKAYLEGLQWDGIPRLDTLFIDYLGAEDTRYTRHVTRKAFTAAVARIMEPGCKFDCMTVLVGEQGRYKSTILAIMGGAWFSDSQRTFEGKEAEELLRGAWIIEVSELQAFDRSSVEAIKGFLSKQADRYRPAYGHMMKEFPRECVLFGTTNTSDFLRDTTGGRRFWPVVIDAQDRTKSVVSGLAGERDQLWAEAVVRYKAGERLFLDGEVEQDALRIQEEHREIDPWEGMLKEYMERSIPADWESWSPERRRDYYAGQVQTGRAALELTERRRVSPTEFLCEWLHYAPGNIDPRAAVRVAKLLRGFPGWRQCIRYRTPYGQVRGRARG